MIKLAKINPRNALKWYQLMEIDEVTSNQPVSFYKQAKPVMAAPPAKTTVVVSSSSARSLADAASTLAELKSALASFDECTLKHTAQTTVFADGNPKSQIMVIGEAPGATEDELGIPFCGVSGNLLDNMFKAIGLTRQENLYISNSIFWRPPANRRPTDEEIEQCRPFVEKHIAIIEPQLLILVGATAVTSLLGNHLQISKIRQQTYQYSNKYLAKSITTTAIFHPAYLLRQPFQKKAAWYDLLKIANLLKNLPNS